MVGTPKVSIVMNCHNGAQFLQEALDSIYNQNNQDWEIIFWDNASTDKSAEIIKNYDGKIRYFHNKEKVSLGKGRNEALKCCRGKYICFLDTDDQWLLGKLEKQLSIMENNLDIDILFTNGYYRFEKNNYSRLIFNKIPLKKVTFGECLRHYPINLQTVMIRRSALENLSGEWIDERYELCEEADLFLRILMQGKGYYSHEPSVIYRIHASMTSIQKRENYAEECGWMLKKLKSLDKEQKYLKDFEYYEAKIAYWEVRDKIEQDWLYANELLSPFKWVNIEFLGLYIVSFLGPWGWRILHRMLKRGAYI